MLKTSTPTFGKIDCPKFVASDLIPNFASYTGRKSRTAKEIRDMASSLLANGQKVPITLRKGDLGEAIPMTGHTRILAADLITRECMTGNRFDIDGTVIGTVTYGPENPFKLVGMIESKMSATDAIFASFVENLDRNSLKAEDYALFFETAKSLGMNDAAIAKKLGKKASFVSNLRKYMNLDEATKTEVANGTVKFDAAHRILTRIDETNRAAVIAKAKEDGNGKATATGIARAAAALGVAVQGTLKRTDADVRSAMNTFIDETEAMPSMDAARKLLFAFKDFQGGVIDFNELRGAFYALEQK